MVYERWSSHHHYDRSFQIDVFSPHWRVGFLFLVLYPPSSASRLPSSRPPLHPPTHPPTHSLSHARTHSLPPSLSLTHSHTHTSLTHIMAGVGQCALPRGRMYALASLWCPLGSAAFAWQAWDNVHCQGVGCTPWRPSGVPWAPLLLRGRLRQAWDNVHWQGVGCTPWRPSGVP